MSLNAHGLRFLDTLQSDYRYSVRFFSLRPFYALTILATLTLTIGAITAVFSVVYGAQAWCQPSRHPV